MMNVLEDLQVVKGIRRTLGERIFSDLSNPHQLTKLVNETSPEESSFECLEELLFLSIVTKQK